METSMLQERRERQGGGGGDRCSAVCCRRSEMLLMSIRNREKLKRHDGFAGGGVTWAPNDSSGTPLVAPLLSIE